MRLVTRLPVISRKYWPTALAPAEHDRRRAGPTRAPTRTVALEGGHHHLDELRVAGRGERRRPRSSRARRRAASSSAPASRARAAARADGTRAAGASGIAGRSAGGAGGSPAAGRTSTRRGARGPSRISAFPPPRRGPLTSRPASRAGAFAMTLSRGRDILAIPGPSIIPDRVLHAMHRPAPNIYEGELIAMTESVLADLRRVARTDGQGGDLHRQRPCGLGGGDRQHPGAGRQGAGRSPPGASGSAGRRRRGRWASTSR